MHARLPPKGMYLESTWPL